IARRAYKLGDSKISPFVRGRVRSTLEMISMELNRRWKDIQHDEVRPLPPFVSVKQAHSDCFVTLPHSRQMLQNRLKRHQSPTDEATLSSDFNEAEAPRLKHSVDSEPVLESFK